MKKCPYCAEDIQEEAIKCKHCGEWLSISTDNTGIDVPGPSQDKLKEMEINSAKTEQEPATPHDTDDTEYLKIHQELPGVKSLPKKPGKYGWGWLPFLLMLEGSAIYNFIHHADFSSFGAACLMPLVFLVPYFALRRMFIKRWEFFGFKSRRADIAAALCTWFMIVLVSTAILLLGQKYLNMGKAEPPKPTPQEAERGLIDLNTGQIEPPKPTPQEAERGLIDLNTGQIEPPKPTPQEAERTLTEGFEVAAKKLNANPPRTLDGNIRFDWASVGPGARITYHYTLTKHSSKDIGPDWIADILRPIIKNKACVKMKETLQYGGTYVYSYSGNDGVWIASFQVDRNDCGLPKITP